MYIDHIPGTNLFFHFNLYYTSVCHNLVFHLITASLTGTPQPPPLAASMAGTLTGGLATSLLLL